MDESTLSRSAVCRLVSFRPIRARSILIAVQAWPSFIVNLTRDVGAFLFAYALQPRGKGSEVGRVTFLSSSSARWRSAISVRISWFTRVRTAVRCSTRKLRKFLGLSEGFRLSRGFPWCRGSVFAKPRRIPCESWREVTTTLAQKREPSLRTRQPSSCACPSRAARARNIRAVYRSSDLLPDRRWKNGDQ